MMRDILDRNIQNVSPEKKGELSLTIDKRLSLEDSSRG